MRSFLLRAAAVVAVATALAPRAVLACACGCGIFDVGDGTFMPNNANSGLSMWFRLAYMDQDRNWQGTHAGPASANDDKALNTTFYFVGGQYVINRDWTVMAELPFFDRALTTTDDGTVFGPPGTIYTGHDFALGDLELMAMYTGFSKDLSTGLGFGVKVPTGDWRGPNGPLGGAEFDRDSLPGTGSTDLIVQAYHAGPLNTQNTLGYFVQSKFQFAVATQDQYRPGDELDSAVGITYDFGSVGPITKVAPVLQFLNSYRARDSGANADRPNSGYERILIDPGVSLRVKKVRLDFDVAIPLYQNMNAATKFDDDDASGQLVAGTLLKFQATYDFLTEAKMRASPVKTALVFAACLAVGKPAWAATPKVGAPAPALTVRTLDGRDIDLGHPSGKVVVVNIWATWCGPCRAEMPMLDAFSRAHAGAGFMLIGVSDDRSRDKGQVRKVMGAFSYPAALLSEAKANSLDAPRVLPLTYVIDKTGVVRAVLGGTGTPVTSQRLEDVVRPLL